MNPVHRALLVVMLEEDQLKKLHKRETERGYPLSAWNVCELFGLPGLAQRFDIPADHPEAWAAHIERIKRDMEQKKLITGYSLDVEQIHSFDWGVFKNKHWIVWEWSGSVKKGAISARVRKSLEVVD